MPAERILASLSARSCASKLLPELGPAHADHHRHALIALPNFETLYIVGIVQANAKPKVPRQSARLMINHKSTQNFFILGLNPWRLSPPSTNLDIQHSRIAYNAYRVSVYTIDYWNSGPDCALLKTLSLPETLLAISQSTPYT